MRRNGGAAAAAGLALALGAGPALAHGFGQRFDLPLPLYLWVWGAGLTIVLSFAVMAAFVRDHATHGATPRLPLGRLHPAAAAALRVAVAAVFLITAAAGWFGRQESFSNLIVPMIWVVWWVGFAFVCAIVGNLWTIVNPLRSLYAVALGTRSLGLPYPRALGSWPAVLFFLAFAWSELVWPENDVPRLLARAMVTYCALTWAAMLLFGRDAWLQRGEAFTVAFGVLGRFAPVAVRDDLDLALRPPGAGLLDDERVSLSMTVFVLTMLSTVTFDGFLETPLFQDIMNVVYTNPAIGHAVYDISEWGISDTVLVKTTALIAFPLLFLVAFFITSRLMDLAAGGARRGTVAVAGAFVLTLVPIAVAYHLAHYFSLLLTSGQFVIPLASDPFGFGWNLFGTAGYQVDIGIVSPKFFWYAATAAIVIGHVIAVYLAHVVALRCFGSRRAALMSQIPMVALMVGYTMVSLWILAQPIVGR